jgi:hypothetical protein
MQLTKKERLQIFDILKTGMRECCPPLVIKTDSKDTFEIIGNVPTPYGYKKVMVPGMYFASAVIREDRVSFYFFPVYTQPELFAHLAPALFKTLKGKTCFTIKKPESVSAEELRALFKKGIMVWKKLGYAK